MGMGIPNEVISLLKLNESFHAADKYYGFEGVSDGQLLHVGEIAITSVACLCCHNIVDGDGGNNGDQIIKGTGLSFVTQGPNLHPKFANISQGLSLEPTAAVLQLLAEFADETNSGVAVTLLEKVLEIPNEDISGNISGNIFTMEISHLAKASRCSHCAWSRANYSDMKSTDDIIGKGTLEPRLQERRISIALEELTISFKAAQDTIQKGEGNNLPHNYIYSCGARVFEIRHQLHNIFLRCLWRQQRLLNAIIAFIDTQAETNPARRSKLEGFKAHLQKQESSPTFDFEITAKHFIAPIEVLASLYRPVIYAGSNALVHSVEQLFIVDDEAVLGSTLRAFILRDDITREAKALPPSNADINWTASDIPLNPPGFIVSSNTNIDNAIVRKLQHFFSHHEFIGTRLIFMPGTLTRAKRGLISVQEIELMCKLTDNHYVYQTSNNIRATRSKRAGQASGTTADSTITHEGDDGYVKGEVGKGDRSDRPLSRGNIVSDKEKDAVYFYGRVVALLGFKFESLIDIAELLKSNFASVKGSEAFRRKRGKLTVPLILEPHYSWIASSKHLNFTCRRDIYAAFQLLRDLMMPAKEGNSQDIIKNWCILRKQTERMEGKDTDGIHSHLHSEQKRCYARPATSYRSRGIGQRANPFISTVRI